MVGLPSNDALLKRHIVKTCCTIDYSIHRGHWESKDKKKASVIQYFAKIKCTHSCRFFM